MKIQISQLLDLSNSSRSVYSSHYKNGQGLVVNQTKAGPEVIQGMVLDPHSLIPALLISKGTPYSNLEFGFLISCSVVCQSRVGGGILFSVVTGRNSEGVSRHSRKLEWQASIPKCFPFFLFKCCAFLMIFPSLSQTVLTLATFYAMSISSCHS